MSKETLNLLFINGKPLSGKDTQADLVLSKNPNTIKISTGDVFRGASSPEGIYGRFYPHLSPYIYKVNQGGLIPDEAMLSVVNQLMEEKRLEGISSFIYTGFPRTLVQLDAVDKWVTSLKSKDAVCARCIWYEISDEVVKIRAKKRREEAVIQGLVEREDDKEEIIEKRLHTYKNNTEPMYKKLMEENRVMVILSDGTKDEIHKKTLTLLGINTVIPQNF